MKTTTIIIGSIVATSIAHAQTTFTEIESNDTKATANSFSLAVGDKVKGNSTSNTGAGADYFLLNLAGAASQGIYLNTLSLASTTAGHQVGLRGLQTDANGNPVLGTDAAVQTGAIAESGTNRVDRFYTFGTATSVNYRVGGSGTTTADYTTTWTQTQITPTAIGGTFNAGSITLNATGSSFPELWVYDSNFNPVAGDLSDATFNDQAQLNLNLAAGTYYVFTGALNVANNQAIGPNDYRAANDPATHVLDFANILSASSSSQNLGLGFNVVQGGTTSVAATNGTTKYTGGWYQLNVVNPVPEPASMFALGLGALGLIVKRRKK